MQIIFAMLMVGVLMLVAPLIGVVVGAVAGWVVGGVFDESMTKLLALLGTDMAPYQLGAMLGFVGGFFRPTSASKSD